MLQLLLVLASVILSIADLPTELDPFLDKLLDTEQCEDFVTSGEWAAQATVSCAPARCNFPHQMCVRPTDKNDDPSSNYCVNVPPPCLTAANGGVPVSSTHTQAPLILPVPATASPVVRPPGRPPGRHGPRHGGGGRGIPAPPLTNPKQICSMDFPTGRFCGFRVMYTYNKETKMCDEFWFPGCPTRETNANLFQTLADCDRIAHLCEPPTAAPTPPQPSTPYKPRPTPAATLPPLPEFLRTPAPPPVTPAPPPAPPQPMPFGKGGGGGLAGLAGVFTGSGLMGGGPAPSSINQGSLGPGGAGTDEDMGLLGLIQKGFQGAQAFKQGGNGGKEAAAAAAGQILQQFTGFDINNIGGNFGQFFGGG